MPVPGPVGPTPPPIAGGNNNYGLGERSVDNTKPQGQQQSSDPNPGIDPYTLGGDVTNGGRSAE